MTLTVAIPAFNEEKYIGACLESIIKFAPEGMLEILVINNASTDRTAEIAGSFFGVRVVNEPQKGLTKARQRALTEAKGDLLAFLDADTKITSQWFSVLEKEFAADPKLVCLSGPYNYYDLENPQDAQIVKAWNRSAQTVSKVTKYAIYGGNFTSRRQALLQAGGFDTAIDFYGEDTDIARRLSALGTVKFSKEFFVYTSARRFKSEGIIFTGLRYLLNYIYQVLFKKLFTRKHKDIR